MSKKGRLEKYLEYKGIGPTAFARALGISNSHVSEIDSRKNNRTLYLAIRSSKAFADCNTEWIDTGEGEMLKSKFQQVAAQAEMLEVKEAEENFPALAAELDQPVVVTHVYLPPREDQRELMAIYESLCADQRDTVMKVAKGLAAALPTKSQPKEQPGSDLTEKNS